MFMLLKNTNKHSYATQQEAYCRACSMLLLFVLALPSAYASDTDSNGSPTPINTTVMGSLGEGTERTYAIGPHDAALVLEKFVRSF